jgi:hypothetical protein
MSVDLNLSAYIQRQTNGRDIQGKWNARYFPATTTDDPAAPDLNDWFEL